MAVSVVFCPATTGRAERCADIRTTTGVLSSVCCATDYGVGVGSAR